MPIVHHPFEIPLGPLTLTGFGTFEVRQRQEREGVNPQTRQKIKIAATKTPGFSASSTLKEAVKGS